jgi:streptogramin lyase
MVMPRRSRVDGKVWTNEVSRQSLMRVDVATGAYEIIDPFKDAPPGGARTPYGLVSDEANNLWFMDFGGESVGRVDAGTLRATFYPTPTRASHPRRGMMAEGKLWFAEFAADTLGSFDIATEKFTEWRAPEWSFPYDVFKDRAGFLWSGNMSNDRVSRLDTKTGAEVDYLLPRQTNMRRVFVDDATEPPTLWVGNNHGAEIVRLEVLK